MAGPGRGGGTGILEGGGGRGLPTPGGFGGRGILPTGGGGKLPGAGAAGGLRGAGATAGLGRSIGIVVRASSLTALFSGRLMRMVSRLIPVWAGKLMRMVSFFTSPMRTVSFFMPDPGWGRLMRIVSFLPSLAGVPGFGGRVIRTVAFLERLGSWVAGGGVFSSAIVDSACIALVVRGVNLRMHLVAKKIAPEKDRNVLLARIFGAL